MLPNSLKIILDQCEYDKAKNSGNQVVYLENKGDFYLAYGNFERIAKETGAKVSDLKASRDYVKHPSATTISEPSTTIEEKDWFGSTLKCCGGTITIRRSSSSGSHPPTLDLNGLKGFKEYCKAAGWQLTSRVDKKEESAVRVEIKMLGQMTAYRKT